MNETYWLEGWGNLCEELMNETYWLEGWGNLFM